MFPSNFSMAEVRYSLILESKYKLCPAINHNRLCFLPVGMGKTIMLSALIQTSLPTQEPEAELNIPLKKNQLKLNSAFRPVDRSNYSSKTLSATLVVAPTSLLNQWEEELKRSSRPGSLDVFIWHGQNRLDLGDVISGHENNNAVKVVITSYGVLASEHAKMERPIARPQVFDSE